MSADKSNAEIARELALRWFNYRENALSTEIESALSSAQSSLAEKVLATVKAGKVPVPESAEETTFTDGCNFALDAAANALTSLFTRLGVKISGE
jgi:hypothetical protein